MSDNEMRSCARGTRCTDRRIVIDQGERIEQPAWTYRPFCDRDREHLITTIQDLPTKYTSLYLELPRSSGHGEKVSGSKTPPVPLRVDVEALMRDMVHTVVTWQEIVAAVAGLIEPGRKRHGKALSDACRALAAHIDALLSLDPWPVARYIPIHQAANLPEGTTGHVFPHAGYAVAVLELDGAQAAIELLELHARCRSVLGLTRRRDLLSVPCHKCGHVAVYRDETSDGIQDEAHCGNCRQTYTGQQWKLLQRVTYEEEIARQAV